MLQYVRATLLNPTAETDWVNMALTTFTYERNKSLCEINGVPAIVYVAAPTMDTFQIKYAYGTKAEPDDATDWTTVEVTNPSASGQDFRPNLLRADEPYPCLTFWHSLTEQLCFATATADPPAGTGSWQITPLTESSASGTYSSWAWWQDKPLVAHAGAIFDDLVISYGAGNYPPATLLDWQAHTAEDESVGISELSAQALPGGYGVAYRDAMGDGSLMYAWFDAELPASAAGWCVMKVDGHASAMGINALALTADNRPAIFYSDEIDGEIRVAVMDPLI